MSLEKEVISESWQFKFYFDFIERLEQSLESSTRVIRQKHTPANLSIWRGKQADSK